MVSAYDSYLPIQPELSLHCRVHRGKFGLAMSVEGQSPQIDDARMSA